MQQPHENYRIAHLAGQGAQPLVERERLHPAQQASQQISMHVLKTRPSKAQAFRHPTLKSEAAPTGAASKITALQKVNCVGSASKWKKAQREKEKKSVCSFQDYRSNSNHQPSFSWSEPEPHLALPCYSQNPAAGFASTDVSNMCEQSHQHQAPQKSVSTVKPPWPKLESSPLPGRVTALICMLWFPMKTWTLFLQPHSQYVH